MTQIDALEILNKITKIYLIYNNKNQQIFINTTQEPEKYLKSILRLNRHKNDLLIDIISNNYSYKFIEYFEYIDTKQIKNKLIELNESLKNREKLQKIINTEYEYGNKKEDYLLPILNTYFNETIYNTRNHNKFCKYDFVGLSSGYKFELKSNKYSFDKYKNALIPVDKIICDKLVLLFNYTYERIFTNKITKKFETVEVIDTYYILYDKELFDTFNIADKWSYNRNRFCKCYEIPTNQLTYLNPNKRHILSTDYDIQNDLINILVINKNTEINSHFGYKNNN
jgi:hypothetical protein